VRAATAAGSTGGMLLVRRVMERQAAERAEHGGASA